MQNNNYYDVIGDVHGCYDALSRLCHVLGYDENFHHPNDRNLVFVGDLINRGPESVRVLRLVAKLVNEGRARMALGNHDETLFRWLRGENVELHDGGLGKTIAQIEAEADVEELKQTIQKLYDRAGLYWILDNGNLIVVHAGIEEKMLWKVDAETKRFILHGDAIGKSPEGKTLRRDWAAGYQGHAFIVYGHTPQPRAEIRHNTVNIDTGAYRGGLLTALRWPERDLTSVPSRYSIVNS